MKKNSGSAEGLTVVTGDHLHLIGKFFKDVPDEMKSVDFDKDVVVEEDVLLSSNVTLLSGVTIGRGSIIGSGAVVRKSVPPYSIVIGNPGRVIGFKFTPEEILSHEIALYKESERLSRDLLEANYNKYFLSKIKDIKLYTK